MKKTLRAKVEKYFDQLIKEGFPEFIRIYPTSMFYSKGEFLYERKINAFSTFILIEEHPKGEDMFRIQGYKNTSYITAEQNINTIK